MKVHWTWLLAGALFALLVATAFAGCCYKCIQYPARRACPPVIREIPEPETGLGQTDFPLNEHKGG